MKKRNLILCAMALMFSATLVSCGSDDNGGGTPPVVETQTPQTPNVLGSNTGEGSHRAATSKDDFRSLIKSMSFVKPDYEISKNVFQYQNLPSDAVYGFTYLFTNCELVEKTGEWWIFDYTNRTQDCDNNNPIERKDYSNGNSESEYGNSKAAIQTKLLELFDNGTNHQLINGNEGINFIYNNQLYTIDFNYPIVANPITVANIENNQIKSYKVYRAFNYINNK